MKNNILCIILHYGSEELTYACLRSLESLNLLDIVIVDNDESQNFLLTDFSKIKLLRTGGNYGFSEANNFGVKNSIQNHHQFIFILNNDTYVEKDAVSEMMKLFDDKRVGSVGPVMPYYSNKNTIWAAGGWINKKRLHIGGYKSITSLNSFQVDYLPGAAFIVRRDLWEKIGGFSELYFLGYEEAIFALELKKYFFECHVSSKAIIYHHVGMSSKVNPMYLYNSIRSRIRFSEYFYGSTVGKFIGIFNTLDVLFNTNFSLKKMAIILNAYYDEFNKKPLNKIALTKIKEKFN